MQGLLDFFGLGGGASPATPQPPMFGLPGMTPEEQAFARQRSMQALLGTLGPSLMAAGQGGIPLAQAGALRAQALSQAAQAPMAAMQAGDQAGQQMLQQRALRSQIAQREGQVASGLRMANFLLGGGAATPTAPGAATPTAPGAATPTAPAPAPLMAPVAQRGEAPLAVSQRIAARNALDPNAPDYEERLMAINNGAIAGMPGGRPAAPPTTPPAPALTPQQAALAAPVQGAAPRTPGFNGNSLANMPAELRVLAAESFARGDHEGGQRIVSDWLTRNPPTVQTITSGGRVREMLPSGELGRDYGPANERGPVLSETQITGLGVPAQSARMIASLGTREEQDQAIRALATRETPRLAEQEDPLRGEFLRQPQVQRFTQSVPLYGTIHTALDRIETGARTGQYDQVAALDAVFALANILDPGSVVRGEEVVTIQRTSGLPGWMQAQIARVNQGAALTTSTIAQMRSVADDRMQVYRNEVNEVGGFYTGLATRRGLNPENVVPGFRDVVAERRAAAEAARANSEGAAPRVPRPPNASEAQIAERIRTRFPGDIEARRRAARAANINPSLVE
jgi:hypothetical protein